MSNFNFKGNITGSNHHFGDIYNYNSLSDFTSKIQDSNFLETNATLIQQLEETSVPEENKVELLDILFRIHNKNQLTIELKEGFKRACTKIADAGGEALKDGLKSSIIDFINDYDNVGFVTSFMESMF